MKERYQGDAGTRRLIERVRAQHVVLGEETLARALVEAGELLFPTPGTLVIEQGGADNDVYFILGGAVDIIINGRLYTQRAADRTVGEMSAINPAIPRSATVRAADNCVLLKVTEPDLERIADAHPLLWRRLAFDLAKRLEERNAAIRPSNERPVIFIICASEALHIAQAIQFAFQYEEAEFRIWSDEVFRASHYPLDDLEEIFDNADFAIAIASAEDVLQSRGKEAKAPRDNVLVELGMAIGKLRRKRSMVLVPRDEEVTLPSDFKGLIPIAYQDGPPDKLAALLGPVCHQIRAVVHAEGVRTDR